MNHAFPYPLTSTFSYTLLLLLFLPTTLGENASLPSPLRFPPSLNWSVLWISLFLPTLGACTLLIPLCLGMAMMDLGHHLQSRLALLLKLSGFCLQLQAIQYGQC